MKENDNYVLQHKKNPFYIIIKIIVLVIILYIMIGKNNYVKINNMCFTNIIRNRKIR